MIFLDCGFYSGGALKNYINAGVVDDSWTVHGFEPNPDLDIKKFLETIAVKVKIHKKAVWTKDTTLKFHISGREDSAGIKDLTGHTEPKEVAIKAVNFSKFVEGLPDEYTICSMDIEGAEYPVLEKMIEDGTIKKINLLDIEFHHRLMNDVTADTTRDLIERLLNLGVAVRMKVPFI